MARFKKFRPRRRWKKIRRYRPKRIPLLPVLGFAIPAVTAKPDNWSSPLEGLQAGRVDIAAQTFVRNVSGIKMPMANTAQTTFEWDIWKTLNPFDFGEAPALKGLFWGGVVSLCLSALGVKRRWNEATRRIQLVKKLTL